MAPRKILPPQGDLSDRPDNYTSLSPDWTGSGANDRVMHINMPFLKYGTNDKTHAASLLLSLLLLIIIVFLSICGMFSSNAAWMDKVFTYLGSAFLFVAGVAVGRSGVGNSKTET